jgi:hypothetical protein
MQHNGVFAMAETANLLEKLPDANDIRERIARNYRGAFRSAPALAPLAKGRRHQACQRARRERQRSGIVTTTPNTSEWTVTGADEPMPDEAIEVLAVLLNQLAQDEQADPDGPLMGQQSGRLRRSRRSSAKRWIAREVIRDVASL